MSNSHEQELIARARKMAAGARRTASATRGNAQHVGWEGLLESADGLSKYEIVRELHRGGQGVVYLARQRSTDRDVAIKVMLRGPLADERERMRFQREILTLAGLRHPNIVTVHDSGVAAGMSYFVMDYVGGKPLDKAISEIGLLDLDPCGSPSIGDTGVSAPLTAPARSIRLAPVPHSKVQNPRSRIEMVLRLFVKICDAVNAAHLRGVMHRDLKPANILVDAQGEPHILDFGLARTQEDVITDLDASVTRTGQFVGSPPWSSPEQVEGRREELDIRTDVYTLGVLLYHAMTGRFPYQVTGRLHEVIARIVKDAPVRPSSITPGLDADIETIILKCLNKEPERRYQSAGELNRDIRHWLAGEPIEARRLSTLYVLRKALLRHRVVASLLGMLLLTLAASGVVLAVLWRTAEAQRAVVAAKAEELLRREYFSHIALANSAFENSNLREMRTRLDACPTDLRGWEWRYLDGHSDQANLTLQAHMGRAGALFTHAGDRIITYGFDKTAAIWSFPGGQLIERFEMGTGVSHASIAPDDSRVIFGSRTRRTPWLDLRESVVHFLPDAAPGRQRWHTSYSADGQWLATASTQNPRVTIWSAKDGEAVWTFDAGLGLNQSCDFAPDGRIATGGRTGVIRVWDPNDKCLLAELNGHGNHRIIATQFSADGRFLVSSCWDNTIRVWNAETYAPIHVLHCGLERPLAIAITPDSRAVAAAIDQSIRTWSLETGGEGRRFVGLQGRILGLGYSPDSRFIAAGDTDGVVKVWEIEGAARPLRLSGHRRGIETVETSPDGRWIATGTGGGEVFLWSRDGGGLARVLTDHGAEINALRFSTNGEWLFAIGDDGRVLRWSVPDGAVDNPSGWSAPITAMAKLMGCDVFAIGRRDGVIELRAGCELDLIFQFQGHDAAVTALEFSHRRLFSSDQRQVRAWELGAGRMQFEINNIAADVGEIKVSPDGRLLATSGGNRVSVDGEDELNLWDATTGRHRHHLRGHKGATTAIAFSPDGVRLASGCVGHLVNLYETGSGALVVSLRGHQGPVRSMCFSPDGTALFTGGWDCLLIWDAKSRTAKVAQSVP